MDNEMKALRFFQLFLAIVVFITNWFCALTTRMFRAQFAPPKWIWSAGENSRQMCRENKLQNTKRWAAEGRKRVQLATLTKWNRKFDCGQRWVVSLSIAFPYHYEYICIYSPTSSYIHTYLPSWLSDWMVYVWHLWPVTEVFFWRRFPPVRRNKLNCTCKPGKLKSWA